MDQGKDDRDPMTLVFLSASPDDVCAAMSSRKELSTFVPKATRLGSTHVGSNSYSENEGHAHRISAGSTTRFLTGEFWDGR